jgi:hypothetical protein
MERRIPVIKATPQQFVHKAQIIEACFDWMISDRKNSAQSLCYEFTVIC